MLFRSAAFYRDLIIHADKYKEDAIKEQQQQQGQQQEKSPLLLLYPPKGNFNFNSELDFFYTHVVDEDNNDMKKSKQEQHKQFDDDDFEQQQKRKLQMMTHPQMSISEIAAIKRKLNLEAMQTKKISLLRARREKEKSQTQTHHGLQSRRGATHREC